MRTGRFTNPTKKRFPGVHDPVPGDLQTSDDEYKSDLNDVRHPWLKTGGGQRLSILEKPRQCLRDVGRRS